MALINIEKDGTVYSVNTQNVTYIAKFDEQTQTYQVFVDGYDNAFTITEAKYQEFLSADYSGGGGGSKGSEVSFDDANQTITIDGTVHQINQYDDTEVKADITTLNGWVKDGWEDVEYDLKVTGDLYDLQYRIKKVGCVEFNWDSAFQEVCALVTLTQDIVDNGHYAILFDVTSTSNVKRFSYAVKKGADVVIPDDFKLYLTSDWTSDVDNKGLYVYGKNDVSYKGKEKYVFEFSNKEASTKWPNPVFGKAIECDTYYANRDILKKSYDGLLDRVTELENKPSGSSMVYDPSTGILSGAKDTEGNDVEFHANTITIQF